ncbi:PilZ domain-containing protein [Celerinatantimonas sp. YJH-8]|uniref:PilZ domain-containing protein n=1 Tax=Celerinatantimonas sp. YJH-8 TaxID=3228714 RepID=UPI0038CAA1B2
MDKALQQQALDCLIPLHREPDFTQIFDRMLQNESKNDKFLIKMELNRLIAPTQRLIDLRGKVDGECRQYQYDGQTHYLDDVGIRTFENLISQYGHYCTGVYEAMQQTENNFRVMNESEKPVPRIKPLTTAIPAFQFHYHGRVEERMYLSVPIELKDSTGEIYSGMSSNMSVSGMRIKLPEDCPFMFALGDKATLYFTGLEKEFANPVLGRGTDYYILDSERNDKGLWLRLKIVEKDDAFNLFFNQFLNAYKGRYRVDVVNLAEAILVKSYQQFFLPRNNSLPLYFVGEDIPQLRFVLSNDSTQPIQAYWRNEFHQNLLGQLFHSTRMAQLTEKESGQTLIYSFVHSYDRKLFFHSATHEELIEFPKLRQLFFHFGSSKTSWRVFLFQWKKADPSDGFLPPIIPHQAPGTDERHVKKLLESLTWLGSLTDITVEQHAQFYHQRFASDLDPNDLARFGQYRYPLPAIRVITHKYLQLRKEDRYQYRSLAEIQCSQGEEVGWVSDFSPGGMRIELDNPLPLKIGEIIHVSLPQFQLLVTRYTLSQLPYKVVNVQHNQRAIHLQVEGKNHHGRLFFTKLIANNLDKLNKAPELKTMAGLSEALRHIYCRALFKHVLFIEKAGAQLRLRTLAFGDAPNSLNELLKLSPSELTADLEQLMRPEQWQEWFITPLKQLEPQQGSIQIRLMLAIHRTNHSVIAIRRESDFKSRYQAVEFVSQAMNNGIFRYIELKLSRAVRPDMDYIHDEMEYMKRYATHRVKELEEQLWNIYAIAEIQDLTAEWQAIALPFNESE